MARAPRCGYDRFVIALALSLPALGFVPRPAAAQVSVNPGALDQLQPAPPAASPSAGSQPATKRPAAKTTRPSSTRHAGTKTAPAAGKPRSAPAAAAATKPPPGRPPSLASAAPQPVTLAPQVLPPPRPLPTPSPVPVVAGAVGTAVPITGGSRITFGAGTADLNQAMVDAVRAAARTALAVPGTDVNLYAYASGPADDPSTPRRLSLARALAVRAVLISEGMVSERIFPRVMPGAPAGPADTPPDRVDIMISSPSPSGTSPPADAAVPAAAPH